MASKRLTFRPHHFLCTLCFQGKGYSTAFVENYQQLTDRLNAREGDTTPIEVVDQADSICAPCPHRRVKSCESIAKINQLDQGHAAVLGIKSGDVLTWKAAKKRLAENMTMAKFHQVCATCEWKTLGICEQQLGKFQQQYQNVKQTTRHLEE